MSESEPKDLAQELVRLRQRVVELELLLDQRKAGLDHEQLFHTDEMEAIGTFADSITHDFNNLLMGIQGYVSLMLYDPDFPRSHRDKLKNMENLVKGGANLTAQILGFARAGKFEVKSLNVNDLLNDSGKIQQGTETILLVDDEEQVVEVNKALLEILGYTVFTAYGGREAVDVYRANGGSIDLVVLDMVMPGMDGEATFKALKQIDPGARVMLSSGYALGSQAAEIMSLGCLGFLQKPYNLTELSDKIREILDKSN